MKRSIFAAVNGRMGSVHSIPRMQELTLTQKLGHLNYKVWCVFNNGGRGGGGEMNITECE